MIAAKFGDPVLGLDVHMVFVPTPAPTPTPLPHPFIGVVFDPIGAAIGAAMGAVFGGGGPVFVNGMPTGNTGTGVKNTPHIPTPPGTGPAPKDSPPGNEGTLVTGSKTVHFAGSSESRTLSSVNSCGFPLNLPTSLCGAIPMGPPVLIGGPEAVDWQAAITSAIRTQWMSEKLHALFKAKPGSRLSKFICFLTGHPVDVMTGELIADAVDAELPGTIPLVFERNYRSRETESLLLGPGWYHFFDAYVDTTPTTTTLRLPDGRPAEHPPLARGESLFVHQDRYTLLREHDGYRITFPDGRIFIFKPTEQRRGTTESRARLVEIRDRGRNVIRLEWQAQYLARIIDTAGRTISARYTKEGKLERLILEDGKIEHLLARYAYGVDGQLSHVFDPLGHAMRYAYRGGVMVREIHKGGLTFHFEWDWEHPEGWCTRTWGDAGESDGACMDFNPGGRPPVAIYDRRILYDRNRHRTMVKDGRGGITHYEGNALGVVEKQIDPTGRLTKYEWNEHAWKLAEENGNGERAEWEYDSRGNCILSRNALGQVTRRTFDESDRLLSVTTPKGLTSSFEYDSSSHVSLSRRPDGTAFLYTRDEFGRPIRVDDPMGRANKMRWSAAHELIEHVDPEGRASTFRWNVKGELIETHDPMGRSLFIERDDSGQPIFIRRFDGEELRLGYDIEGNLISQRDSVGRTVVLRYAGMCKLVEHTDPMGHRVRLRYDVETDLVAVENQHGERYDFALDLGGRVLRERSFSGSTREYVYDKAGRPTQSVSGAYRVIKYDRDPLGRVVHQSAKGGNPTLVGVAAAEETFTFDADGALLSARTIDAEINLERDALGRILKEHEKIVGTSFNAHVASRYDAAGLRVERTTSLHHRAEYSWNRAGELAAVKADWDFGPTTGVLQRMGLAQALEEPFEIRFARDALGNELARRLPGGVVSLWKRDPNGRPEEQRIVTGASTQSAGAELDRRLYAWSGPDQLASIAHLGPTGAPRTGVTLEYDPRGHLIRELFSTGEALERQSDAAGNVFRSRDRADRTYGAGGVLRRANGTEYEVDADGFLIRKTLSDGAVWKYAWDAHGQLVAVTRPDGKKATFAYDAFGRRVTKTFDGRTTEYVWDGNHLAHERQHDGPDAPLTTWVFDPQRFTPLAKFEGHARFGIVTDHLGAPLMVTNAAGQAAWDAQLDIYGIPRTRTTVPESEGTENPWRFPGQYEDPETGLFYNRFRYYDPELGRYLSEDPIGLAGGLAQYSYVFDPETWIDPLGLALQPVDFSNSPDLFPAGPGQKSIVQIPMQGTRERDFTQAFKESGIPRSQAADYTWHHVHDFNPETGMTTMQLVSTTAHEASLPHIGSVAQFEKEFGVKYGPEAVLKAQEKGWLKRKIPKKKPPSTGCA